ncbi:exonuclease domain-containing protein [Pseudomonas sp. LRF_L74]|uniref:exonuclease domain-containing protein n=1 Tax=Pseudomonas sp. LRF_L74 TaxID=3369422 RepID=UPI003F60A7DC
MRQWLVIDLEATTEEGGWPVADMEIIEIGASLVAADGRELEHFQRFVRPLRRPCLTTFCQKLTHIRQSDIDGAGTLASLWPQFEHWLEPHRPHLEGWVSWGDYDRRQFEQEWRRQAIDASLARIRHVNLKQAFAKARHLQRPVGLHSALQLCGLSFQGQQHRALEDARNTARLLPQVFPT